MTDLTKLSPSEIDAELFPLWADRWTAGYNLQRHLYWIAKGIKRGAWQAQEDARQEAKLREALQAANAAVEPYEAEYERRGGWARYVFVPDGHLHHYACHTLDRGQQPTQRLLTPAASGHDEAWIVEHFESYACTYCFPSAPVDAFDRRVQAEKAARKAERDAEKAAKAAKQAEKNLLAPVRVHHEVLRTVYAAKLWLKSAYDWGLDHPAYPPADVEAVRAALVAKGVEVAPLQAKWAKAAAR